MAFRFDPRGDLPPPMLQSTYYKPLLPNSQRADNTFRGARAGAQSMSMLSYGRPLNSQMTPKGLQQQTTQPAASTCYDWIFSSASNVHVAIDRSTFKTYTAFKSYVLTVSDGTPVKVRGIGTVELKIRRQPGNKESHCITLENVLHVPKWICNVFSDVYFEPINAFEHTWTDFGVSFLKKEDNSLTYWGFTEGFLGLERLVLAKKRSGRSPMLEDVDREVFSVNLTWPQGQRDKWELFFAAEEEKRQERQAMKLRRQAKSGLTMTTMTSPTKTIQSVSIEPKCEDRHGLSDLSTNIMLRRNFSDRASSLKAPTTNFRDSSFTERYSKFT